MCYGVRRFLLSLAGIVTLLVAAGCGREVTREDPMVAAQGPAPVLAPQGRLFADPEGVAAQWVAGHSGDPAAERVEGYIAGRGAARTLSMPAVELRAQVGRSVDAARLQESRALFVADVFGAVGCGGEGYAAWFAELAAGIGDGPASVVLRDDNCASASLRAHVMAAGVRVLRAGAPEAQVLLDATNLVDDPRRAAVTLAGWSVSDVDGIAINIGQYRDGIEAQRITTALRAALREKTGRDDLYVVADSRNGARNVPGTACNPPGARIGPEIMWSDDPAKVILLRLTVPGTSDGPCGIAPDSGKGDFVPEIAMSLLRERP